MNAMMELEARVAADLAAIRFPDRPWVIPTDHPTGAHVYDVVIVGAGHCGLTLGFALQRRRITNILLIEQGAPGQQGPWCTYGRMPTLRSPKHFNGPDLDIPSLTCEAWYRARHGDEAWDDLQKIPCADWMDYLLWFREVTGLPARYEERVERVGPDVDGLLRVEAVHDGAPRRYFARKVVFATGVEGSGAWTVPPVVEEALPADRYSIVADPPAPESLQGARIGVLGGGASAYDNAAELLEHGASTVDLFFRRPVLHRVNPHKWTEFAGFLSHFRDLPDAWRWRFMRHILPLNEPPPPETFRRAARHDNFRLHLGEQWQQVEVEGGEIHVKTQERGYEFDHVIVATGLAQDVRLHRELADAEPYIARWQDRYHPPTSEQHAGLAQFPYLGPHFEYVERQSGTAAYLSDIHNFTAAATVSHGPSGSSINGMKQAATRIADGICRDLFTRAVEAHYADLVDFAEPELDVPWPGPDPVQSARVA